MAESSLISGLKGKSIDVVYTVPVIDRLLEKGEPGVTRGILKTLNAYYWKRKTE